ncbi:MAG: hypothetical protein A3A96_02475 [Candidatus Zambryskibacteria bacterium RIFCSPLOWO2_01_FULL_39_39]|uniref:Uncharacterized protein n=1 Tax=Candidatus Zambryskibacteria bacterium RIFCSPLOWO2_01_FULL_39_39 TaxID=1802758 RepID=A0A1G2TZT0_9BACT|nr:MAG: hypothetical protein UT00_C0010G0018 [Parcubacteria group bacterium GW2011_GWA1_38_7]OHA87179.1 MAG: hypothetical protein A2644_02190 [Candidatus Zambryskibacteria bacterium RIFCSPHIGHO2_01_FULL_39_63]OHA94817.1 MAG: hypothetical protein A3B88_04235 [Candidatus Zambryskibacteria bacterium RIFCSPHIGHO2_02_FULL_39_19]OHA98307.1 MAG: hypothetical protein A3F20_01925 [Candidatus Zambryskibacteria bacterium RIFCSPHIGHO2_12_FULL_39_21]OHB02693.1 MAG: hypothetical protein A3A96_02475 [Candidat
MLKQLQVLDEFCIVIFEKCCQWIQIMVGINNFVIAKLLVLISVIAGLYHFGDNVYMKFGIAGVEIVARIYLVVLAESKTKVESGVGFPNPLRFISIFCYFRMYLLALLIIEIGTMGKDIFHSASMWLFYVIVACNPLPPGASKFGEWLRSFVPHRTIGASANS